jgi:hypothetical protein
MAVRSVLRAGSPLSPWRFLVLISVRGWVDTSAIVWNRSMINPMTSSEPATYRLVAQCLNQLRYCSPRCIAVGTLNLVTKLRLIVRSCYGGKTQRCPLDRRLDGPRNWCGSWGDKSISPAGNRTPIHLSSIVYLLSCPGDFLCVNGTLFFSEMFDKENSFCYHQSWFHLTSEEGVLSYALAAVRNKPGLETRVQCRRER